MYIDKDTREIVHFDARRVIIHNNLYEHTVHERAINTDVHAEILDLHDSLVDGVPISAEKFVNRTKSKSRMLTLVIPDGTSSWTLVGSLSIMLVAYGRIKRAGLSFRATIWFAPNGTHSTAIAETWPRVMTADCLWPEPDCASARGRVHCCASVCRYNANIWVCKHWKRKRLQSP